MQMVKTKVYIASVAPLSDGARFERLRAALPPWRQQKADRATAPYDARRSLGAGLLLKIALAEQGVDIGTAAIGEQNGKPYLKDEPHCHFSLSHSGDFVMCAVSAAPVGCDVQQMKPLAHDVAKRFFTDEEYRHVMHEPTEEAKQQMFFRLWTLKESFTKATAQGFSLPMSRFSVLPQVMGEGHTCSFNEKPYYFKEYNLDGYCAACCGESASFADDLITVDFSNM